MKKGIFMVLATILVSCGGNAPQNESDKTVSSNPEILKSEGNLEIWETYNDENRIMEIIDSLKTDNIFNYLFDFQINSQFAAVTKDNLPHVKKSFEKMATENKFPLELKFMFALPRRDTVAIYLISASEPLLTGDHISTARPKKTHSYYQVSMAFDAQGTKKWNQITRDNIGKQLAFSIDNWVYMCPFVNQEITNGVASIFYDFTKEEAEHLSKALKK